MIATQSRALCPSSSSCLIRNAGSSVSRPVSRARTVTKAISDVNLVVGGCTMASLALGRLAFLPFHRNSLAKAGKPQQNGKTHAEAGDLRAQEATFILSTNDPAGFNIIDVFAWGALGHALAFWILATGSLDKAPIPY